MTGPARSDRGAATIWVLALAAMILAATSLVVVRGSAVLARHRLERSSEQAALAAANEIGGGRDPCLAAARLAIANGAQLDWCAVSLDPAGRTGTVRVQLDQVARLPLAGARTVSAHARAGRLSAAELAARAVRGS